MGIDVSFSQFTSQCSLQELLRRCRKVGILAFGKVFVVLILCGLVGSGQCTALICPTTSLITSILGDFLLCAAQITAWAVRLCCEEMIFLFCVLALYPVV